MLWSVKRVFPFLLLLLSGIALWGCNNDQTSPPNSSGKPNIILILADDMGYSDMGAYGGEIKTPNLNRLTDQGIQFNQFYNDAHCEVTRAELMTGLYHQQTNTLKRRDNNVTIAEALGKVGYQTIMAGKWHLGHWKKYEDTPPQRGFDHYFGFLGGAINYYTGIDWGTGKNYMRMDTEAYNVPKGFYSTDYFTHYAIKQITKATKKSNNPFFLYLAYNAPHFPLQVPQKNINYYRRRGTFDIGWDSLRSQRYARMKQMGLIKPQWMLSKRDSIIPPWRSLNKKRKTNEGLLMATYAGMITRMDHNIGRLMNRLQELGIDENTIVMFLSDNGACPFDFNRTPNLPPGPAKSKRSYDTEWANVSNTPFRMYKQWIQEGGIATPLIVRWPQKIKAGSRTRIPAQLIDIVPTLLDAANATYPNHYSGHHIHPMEGKSLLPVLEGTSNAHRDTLYWEYIGSRAVRIGSWKLVASRGKTWGLYDLDQDRTEINNLIKKYPDKAAKMEKAYNRWARRVGARTNAKAESMKVNSQPRLPIYYKKHKPTYYKKTTYYENRQKK